MIKQKMLVFMLVFTSAFYAQKIGTWNNHTDMKNIIESAVAADIIWAVTNGGAFNFNIDNDSYNTFTKSDGLSSHVLTSIAIDVEGKIWFGTQEGIINVFNPSTNSIKKILDIYNTDKTQKRINDLYISGDTVFASTSFGLSLINSNAYTFYETIVKFGDFPAETQVNGSYKDNLLYVCTGKGVAIQKSGAQNLSAPESWNSYTVTANSVHKLLNWNNELILATDTGVLIFDGTTWNPFIYHNTDIKDLVPAGESLFVLTKHQLYSFENSNSTLIYEDYQTDFSDLIMLNDDYYISTNKGIFNINTGNIATIFPDSPESNSMQSIAVDNDGIVWIGSGRDEFGVGVFEFNGTKWINHSMSNQPEFVSNSFHTVYASSDGTKYFANWGQGFTRLSNGIFETFNAANTDMMGIPDDPNFLVIRNIVSDSKNNTWLLNYNSINRKPLSVLTPDNQWYHFSFDNPSITENTIVECIVVDQYDTKWFAVTEGRRGLYYFNENNTLGNTSDDETGYISSANFASDIITALAIDNRGQIWIGTNNGLNIIQDPSRPTSTITLSYGLRQQTVNAIVVDPLNRKWVGTNQGLFLMTQDGIQIMEHYNIANSPLPSDLIKSLAIDKNSGVLYIGTDFGLTSLATEAVQPLENFSELFVFPNPFIIDGVESVQLTIDGLIRNSEVKILSIAGNLVKSFSTPGGRVASWDGRDENGKFVPSGIYIIVAYDEEANNVAKTKVAVLKK